jgi:hypothetical protein
VSDARQNAIPAEPNESGEPHDVLAAEQFAIPAPAEARPRGPVVLPDDPYGMTEPHDVLAAEEFPMPAPPPRTTFAGVSGAASARRSRVAPLLAGLGVVAALRRRRAKRS